MYLDKKPKNGVLYGIIINDKGISYDIYYISNPTIIQKIYYRNFNPQFYIGVISNHSYNTSLFFSYNLNNIKLPLPLKKRSSTNDLLRVCNVNNTDSPLLLQNKQYKRKYRKTYPEL